MLDTNFTLKELYLGWNKITHYGGHKILIGLEESQLAVLDLS